MKLLLQRNLPAGKALTGTLYIDGHAFCSTMENTDYLLYPGWYPVRVTMSPKFQRLLPLLDNTFPRTGIRIHRGTKPEHSKGCILVLPNQEPVLTQRLLAAQRQRESIYIEIQSASSAMREARSA